MTWANARSWVLLLAGLAGPGFAYAADSLYLRLGGEAGVTAIATTLVDRAAADPLTGATFEDVKLDRLKRLIAEHLCDLSGGPCRYSGDPMKESHAGLHITQAMFYRMVENLRTILRERHVDRRSTNQLLALLAPMKRDVVEHAAQRGAP